MSTGEEIINGYYYNLYHSVVDIDGDTITSGWDIDLDGIHNGVSCGFTMGASIEPLLKEDGQQALMVLHPAPSQCVTTPQPRIQGGCLNTDNQQR